MTKQEEKHCRLPRNPPVKTTLLKNIRISNGPFNNFQTLAVSGHQYVSETKIMIKVNPHLYTSYHYHTFSLIFQQKKLPLLGNSGSLIINQSIYSFSSETSLLPLSQIETFLSGNFYLLPQFFHASF